MGNALHAPIAIIDKSRPKDNEVEVMGIVGDVKGKTAIIIDDLIDTAGTITRASEALKDAGALEVFAACTHPILSHPAVERLEKSAIEEVITTNTIELTKDKESSKLKQLSIAPLLGQGIMNIILDKPLSALFNPSKD
jgi:ribose-phosphate pyrophosphokinase